MYAVDHAQQRILERTGLFPDAVLEILEAGAYVDLGADKKKESVFCLFYSEPDEDTKIALVALKGKARILSVWENHFSLPPGVMKPNKSKRGKAFQRWQEFLFERAASRALPDKDRWTARMIVSINGRNSYEHDCGEVPENLRFSKSDTESFLNDTLRIVVHVIEENRKIVHGRIQLHVAIKNADTGQVVRVHVFSFKRLKRKLEAASS